MKRLKIISLILLIITVVSSFIYSGYSFIHRNDIVEVQNIANSYKDSNDKNVKTINQIVIDLNDAREALATAKSDRTSFQKELVWLYGEYDALDYKFKQLKSAYIFVTETKGGGEFELKDSTVYVKKDSLIIDSTDIKTGYFNDGYLSQIITMPYPYVDAQCEYTYSDSALIFDTWIRKPNKKGKQVFYPIRWMRSWIVKVDIKLSNKNTEIKSATKILTNKKK